MGKLKDLILAINESINSNELSALAGAGSIQDVDVQDDTLTEVKTKLSSLMSADAAKNNPDVKAHYKKMLHPEIKGELFGNLDTDILQQSRSVFGEDVVSQFEGLEYTGDKVKKVFELTQKLAQDKSSDDKLKATNQALQKQMEELTENLNTKIEAKESELKTAHEDFKNKLIRERFNGLMADYKLGEKFSDPDYKEFLSNKMYSKVSEKAHLAFNDTGAITLKNPSDVNIDLYENGKKVESIKELLDPLMESYVVKQSDPQPGQKPTILNPEGRVQTVRKLSPYAEDLQRQANGDLDIL
jgi:hypothetical protein